MSVSGKYVADMLAHPARRTLIGENELESLLREVQQCRALSATRTDLWEPIETAPKDGRLVMLCRHPHPGYIDAPIKVGGWWDDKWNIFGGTWWPTHWQPLPAPPITTEGE